MDKYLQYTIEELALDESFIHWVNQSNHKDVSFWNDWTVKHPSKKEDVEKAIALVKALKIKQIAVEQNREGIVWDKINKATSKNSIEGKHSSQKISRNVFFRWAAVAAGFLLVAFFTFGRNSNTSVSTSLAETQTINLPDGSIVELNADSELTYNKKSFLNDRVLKLSGEAFFSVEKGSIFKVELENAEVEVLGTSFNIYNRNSLVSVQCQTGRVAVKNKNQATILNPNEEVRIAKDSEHQKSEGLSSKRSDWKNNLFHFDSAPLKDVVDDLRRQLNVDIILDPDELSETKFTGSFSSKELDTALSEVCWPLGLEYKVQGNKVNIFKR